jgi:signal transduction histidine kinase
MTAMTTRVASHRRSAPRRLTAALERLPEPVVVAGPQGQGRRANAAARRLLVGTTSPAVPDENPAGWCLLSPDGRVLAPAEDPFRRAAGGAAVVDEPFLLRRVDGTTVPVRCQAVALPGRRGTSPGAVLTMRPAPPPAGLRGESSTSEEELLGLFCHELRGPMTPLLSAAELLEHSGDPVVLARARAIVGRQVRHLARLVDQLQEVGRIARGRFELNREPVALKLLVDCALSAARPLLQERNHRVDCAYPPLPVMVNGDAIRLTQALESLVDNAARYTPAGGEVRLSATAEAGAAVVRVRDSGVGLAPQVVPRLFRFFSRVEPPAGALPPGLGVGLAVARRLVEAHGGTVEASSDGPGQGSEFVVRLPAV